MASQQIEVRGKPDATVWYQNAAFFYRYDEGRATSIMSHTREFMRLLASRP